MPATGRRELDEGYPPLTFDELLCITDACRYMQMMLVFQEEEAKAAGRSVASLVGHASMVDVTERALAGLARIGFYKPTDRT